MDKQICEFLTINDEGKCYCDNDGKDIPGCSDELHTALICKRLERSCYLCENWNKAEKKCKFDKLYIR